MWNTVRMSRWLSLSMYGMSTGSTDVVCSHSLQLKETSDIMDIEGIDLDPVKFSGVSSGQPAMVTQCCHWPCHHRSWQWTVKAQFYITCISVYQSGFPHAFSHVIFRLIQALAVPRETCWIMRKIAVWYGANVLLHVSRVLHDLL